MLFKIIFTLTAFAGIAQAGQLRASTPADQEVEFATRGLTEITETAPGIAYSWPTKDYESYAFYLESKGWGDDYYLGSDSNKNAYISSNQAKFVYYDFQLERYTDDGRTGECYEMDSNYRVTLKQCNGKEEQKWLLSLAPEEYGHYYTVTNAYYGYVLNYSPSNTYKVDSRSWKDYNYEDGAYIQQTLFYKGAIYDKNTHKACRTFSGGKGEDNGTDYSLYKGIGRDICSKYCSDDYKCKGWEYSTSQDVRRCEIWYTKPEKLESLNGASIDCYVKRHY